MKLGATVIGAGKLSATLKAMAVAAGQEEDVVVGFSQHYALHVHERTEIPHNVGEAKFLETAVRMLMGEMRHIAAMTYAKTGSITKGLLIIGLRIQREAQKLTPVDTGALKNSAYTAKESHAEAAANAAAGRGWDTKEKAK